MTVRAVCFDLDGTLLDSKIQPQAFGETCATLAQACGGPSADELLEANQRVWAAYWPMVEEQWTLGSLSGAEVSLEAWRRTLAAFDVRDEALCQLALETHERNASNGRTLYSDVSEILDRFSGRLPIVLITNGASDTQREKLRSTGIEELFDACIISGEIGLKKPDPAIFNRALGALKVAPAEALHVGDSLALDIAGALNAGLTAVWLNRLGLKREAHEPAPHHEINALNELLRLI